MSTLTFLRWIAVCSIAVASLGAHDGIHIKTLSSRADMVTGGDALVEISGPSLDGVAVTLNGNDVTSAFHSAGSKGRLVGKLEGLREGENRLDVKAGEQKASLEITNHPITGPVISGPHQTPFICQTAEAGLGAPVDANCSAKTRVDYFYASTEPAPAEANARGAFPAGYKPLDPSKPLPTDIAKTTTTEGKSVPHIVRREMGTINRAIYQIAFLHQPGSPLPNPLNAGEAWNGRLVYWFGGGCKAGYRQGPSRSGLSKELIGKGFATAASSLNVFGNNCNDVLSAETMMMVKEHFIESFGKPLYTIGSGGSGGSMQQHLIAQNYPGLLDGINPGASYPDTISIVAPVTDCALLDRFFEGSGNDWTDAQKTAVSGYATWASCGSWMRANFAPGIIRSDNCDDIVSKEKVYEPTENPGGARCGLFDNLANTFERDGKTGFAPVVLDTLGVQYGLDAFNAGKISAEQFVEVNERIGGFDADGNIVGSRSEAEPEAVRAAYQNGRVNRGGGSLGSIPIIDVRRYVDPSGNIHDSVRSVVMRERLARAYGNTSNRVELTNTPAGVSVELSMDEWLGNMARDTAGGSVQEKIERNRPKELTDACWTEEGEKNSLAKCAQLFPPAEDPQLAAGAPITEDVLKCALKPLDRADYSKPLGAEQMGRLRAVFPQGVCDYSKPGVGQGAVLRTWVKY